MDFTESFRQTLLMVISILALVCFFSSFMLFACAAYIKVRVDARMKLIETYNSDVLPGVFLFVGVINLAQNVTFLWVSLKLKTVDNRESLMRLLLPILIGGIILVVFEVSTTIASFVHISILDKEFGTGLTKAMEEYVKGGELKVEMDTVQSEYGCCGDLDYTEWFQHSWLDPEFLKVSQGGAKKYFHTDGKYYSDDTPFSCCDMRSPRPCIHHHIHDNSRHHNYNYMVETTLFVRGCREVLMEVYSHVLVTVAVIALIIASCKTTALLLFRLVQTSLVKAQEQDDWEATTPAYIYYPAPTDGDLEKKLQEEDTDTTEEKTTENEEDTSENANTDYDERTESSQSSDNDKDNTTTAITIDENKHHSDDIYANDGKDGDNKRYNTPAWRPLSFSPVRQCTNHPVNKKVSQQMDPADSSNVNRNTGQLWTCQNLGYVADYGGEFAEKDNDTDNDYLDDGSTKCPEMLNNRIKSTDNNAEGIHLAVNRQCFPPRQTGQAYGNRGGNAVNAGSFENTIRKKNCKINRDLPNKQVRFHTQKPRLLDGHGSFANKLFDRFLPSNKVRKTYKNSSDNHKYSLISANSDSEEDEEEEDYDEEEDSNSGDECDNYPSDSNDTDNRDQSCQSYAPNDHKKIQEHSQKVNSGRLTEKNDFPRSRLHEESQAAQQKSTDYRSNNDQALGERTSSWESSLCRVVHRDGAKSLTDVHMPRYHEENETDNVKRSESRINNVKQKNKGKIKNDLTNASSSTRVYEDTIEAKVLESKEQTMSFKTGAEMGIDRSHRLGLPLCTGNSIFENSNTRQRAPWYSADNAASEISSSETNSMFPSNCGQRLSDQQRMTSAQSGFDEDRLKSGFDEERLKHKRLAELKRKRDSSETESELASTEPHIDTNHLRQRFIGRSTPFPYEILRYEEAHCEEYDLIPTNIRRNKESSSNSVYPFLTGKGDGNMESPIIKVDIPESDVEFVNPVITATTLSVPGALSCHAVQKNVEVGMDTNQQIPHAQHLSKNELHQEKQMTHKEDKTMDEYYSGSTALRNNGIFISEQISSKNRDIGNTGAKTEYLMESRCATSSFSLPLLMPSPNSYEFVNSARNHVRSYQRRSVVLASPFSSASSNSPINSCSTNLALFSSPVLDSPMETSTPILCTKRTWDSLRCQTLSSPMLDNNTAQSARKHQLAPTSKAKTFAISHDGMKDTSQSKHQGILSTLSVTHPKSLTAAQQLVPVKDNESSDNMSEGQKTTNLPGNGTSAEHSHGPGRVLISPFN